MAKTTNGYSVGNLVMGADITSLQAMNAELKTTKSLLGAMSSSGKSGGTSTRSSAGSFSKALNFGKLVGKLYFIRNYTKQIGRGIANMVQSAIDYTETLNMWQVAMRDNVDIASEFIDKMNKAYGISKETLMRYQATFKNMLSSLGGISDSMSYILSERLSQMALDFASLYNTSVEKAMTTFQSVLSGQVRPIRSISGYDITETTIFDIYQRMGGEKTMRQLSQTEKRLLRIYAVFEQMDRSGAIGDLNATLENSANQLRIMNEQSKELGQWLGIIFEMWLRPILPTLNAILITTKNIIKALAIGMGYKDFERTVGALESVNEQLDETQGKLLSFDRFEALNSGGNDNILGIDEKLIAGLSQYESKLESVTSKTNELVAKWNNWWFEEGDPEKGLTSKAEKLLKLIEEIGIALVVVLGLKAISVIGKFGKSLLGLNGKIFSLNTLLKLGLIYTLTEMIKAFKDGEESAGLLAIGATLLGGALVFLELKAKLTSDRAKTLAGNLGLAFGAIGLLVTGITQFVNSWDDMSSWERAIGIIITLTAAVTALAIATHGFKNNWGKALAITGMVAGGALTIYSSINSLKQFKTGGLVEDGIFTMNKGEVMGTFDDGTSIVANNQQIIDGIKAGVYQAVVSANSQNGNGGTGNVYLDGKKVGQYVAPSSHREMVRAGYIKANA